MILIFIKNSPRYSTKSCSAVYDTLRNCDLGVNFTPQNDDSAVYFTPQNGNLMVYLTRPSLEQQFFAQFCSFLTLFKPILNSES